MEQNNIYKSVFKVTHSGGSGSCFYLKAYDLFVTNYHVTEGFRTVAIHDNERNPYLAKVVLANPAMDIALLAAEGDFSSLPDISLAEDDTLTIGRKVYVAGYPYGMPFTITEGSVSSPKQLMDGKYYIQTDAAVNPGNSGGPILDEDNRVVGVTVSKFTQADNMGFGIRVETLHALLDTIGDLDRTVFQVQCGSCEELIAQEEEYCPSCGDKLPEGVFEEREQSPLGGFVESAIEQMGVNPVLARDGYDSWLFHKGSSEIRIFVYDNNYLSMNPLFRTDEVLRAGETNAETAEMIRTMRAQEKFDSAFVLNASLGKNWYIKRNYTLGFSLEVKNILNNQDIKTGGYEQMRLNKIKADESNTSLVTSYERFDPKYFYMFGTTYYLNVYFRF